MGDSNIVCLRLDWHLTCRRKKMCTFTGQALEDLRTQHVTLRIYRPTIINLGTPGPPPAVLLSHIRLLRDTAKASIQPVSSVINPVNTGQNRDQICREHVSCLRTVHHQNHTGPMFGTALTPFRNLFNLTTVRQCRVGCTHCMERQRHICAERSSLASCALVT